MKMAAPTKTIHSPVDSPDTAELLESTFRFTVTALLVQVEYELSSSTNHVPSYGNVKSTPGT